MTPLSPAAAKLDKYSAFAQGTLEPALARVQAGALALGAERAEYAALKARLEDMAKAADQGSASMEMLMDLGSEVFVNARIPDTHLVAVDLGLGQLFVELTPAAGAAFCAKRDGVLAARAKLAEAKEADLKQQIAVVHNAIQDVIASRADELLAN